MSMKFDEADEARRDLHFLGRHTQELIKEFEDRHPGYTVQKFEYVLWNGGVEFALLGPTRTFATGALTL